MADPLATPADLANTLPAEQPLPDGDLDHALSVASDAVRAAAHAFITEADVTVTLPAPYGRKLTLPAPVKDVTSVLVDGNAVSQWRADVDGIWCDEGWAFYGNTVAVSYTYGYAVIPDDIKDLVVQLAIEWLEHNNEGGGSTAGLQSVKVDDASESYTPEASAQMTSVYVPKGTAAALERRFGAVGATVVEYR